jgi:hypothetical protein
MEKLPHYNFSWTALSKNRETQFGRGYGPVARQILELESDSDSTADCARPVLSSDRAPQTANVWQ